MPPMSPPGMPPGIAGAGSGLSATTASVVRNRAAIDAAFCSAERVTLAASMTPAFTRSSYSPVSGVEAVGALEVAHLLDDDAALVARVHRDLLQRLLERPGHRAGAGRLVTVERLDQLDDLLLRPEQGHAATGDDALLDRGLGRLHRVLDAVLLLLELDLGGRADLDDRDATRQLREALLELLTVVVGVGVVDLALDLRDATLDVLLLAATLDDRRLVLGDDDLAGTTEQVEADVLELEADLLARRPGHP